MRYFIEVSYKGTRYAGFQIQANAPTIQAEVERALKILFKVDVKLTGSSRTDAGVHAHQNFFHFDVDFEIPQKVLYNINALLPHDIAVRTISPVQSSAHARFDALSREYSYFIYAEKSPFLVDTAWYFPYTLNIEALNETAGILLQYQDFTAFAKRNSQVHTHNCNLQNSAWHFQENKWVYTVKANRFLRGMVRGLVGTMLQVGRGATSLNEFRNIIEAKDCTKANFTTPPHGLFLNAVHYPVGYFS